MVADDSSLDVTDSKINITAATVGISRVSVMCYAVQQILEGGMHNKAIAKPHCILRSWSCSTKWMNPSSLLKLKLILGVRQMNKYGYLELLTPDFNQHLDICV